ncbi:hypothetical protein H257_05513 [Aphanomyces astaci]|uniref:Reverse transcriptase RNase H-like domain-containing protein n=1 Tax=Aphanomyces astaci TaxID=112090 RepID=W4GRM3_APHAT|nr:hypothetical protein H257_05513 [Aphanomyces astaci]ETV81986.1 hypothetical protein H257_05513 [Aphanomyces astaci]|eukprot:XP_009828723.1 hypothetical protein H257_05513 [Aphanomyces astaci]
MFDFGKSHGDVTEVKWVTWFMEAHDEAPAELAALMKCLQVAVQFDTKILDADIRVSRMLDNLMKILEAYSQEWVLHQEAKLMTCFVNVKRLLQSSIGYQLYGGMDEEKPSKPPKEKLAASTTFQPGPDEPPERPMPKCLKYQSTAHGVREHPSITDAEVTLMDDFHQACHRSVNFLSSTTPANSMECQASIENVITLPQALLDSGSDETLVSEGLLVALERRLGATLRQSQEATVTLETSIAHWSCMDLERGSVESMAEAGDASQTSANPEDALYAEDVACAFSIVEAIQLGLSPAQEVELWRILNDHADLFRLEFGQDLPMWCSFMTPFGAYTPTRILMGQTDAVAYYQSVVNQMFVELFYAGVLGSLDDLLGCADNSDSLFVLLVKVLLSICRKVLLKLHPKKCFFFLKAMWCGKVISAEGISHSPDRVEGLCALETPTSGADLQQFVCATNWMRSSIPSYSEMIDPLRGVLDLAAKAAGGPKKMALARIKSAAVGSASAHDACFAAINDMSRKMVPLSHPSADMVICLYTDASDTHWGAACTQIPPEDLELPVDQQRHEPLEAFAIVESCKRLEYLQLRQQGFRLFTDHRSLLYIFNTLSYNSNMAQYQANNLKRWTMVMTMTTFSYIIESVAGGANVRLGLLRRWDAAPLPAAVARVRQLVELVVVSPLQDKDFAWLTPAKILGIKKAAWKAAVEDVPNIWIPESAVDLQQRICIIAHQGVAGHRGVDVTTQGGAALHTERPNEFIHFDWLQLPPAANGWNYVLVIQDDMSGFSSGPFGNGRREKHGKRLDGLNEVVGKIKRMIV